MHIFLAALFLSFASPVSVLAADPAPKAVEAILPKTLAPGRHTAKLRGILCEACKRAILRELRKLPEIEEASFDEETPTLSLTVAKKKNLRLSRIQRALAEASSRIDLGTEFTLEELR
ncbi:MAG: cation transporter [Elusimicrobiota bacterium]|jgi:hypothetical protein